MKEDVLKYPNGLTDYIVDLNSDKNAIHEPITLKTEHEGVKVELCCSGRTMITRIRF